MFIISLLTIFTYSILVVPKIERYTQAATIDFYKSLQSQDCYLETAGFKSYAYLFYSNKQPNAITTELLNAVKEFETKEIKEGINDPLSSFSRYSVLFMLYNKLP